MAGRAVSGEQVFIVRPGHPESYGHRRQNARKQRATQEKMFLSYSRTTTARPPGKAERIRRSRDSKLSDEEKKTAETQRRLRRAGQDLAHSLDALIFLTFDPQATWA